MRWQRLATHLAFCSKEHSWSTSSGARRLGDAWHRHAYRIDVACSDLEQFKSTMSTLPPHREVPEALERLASAGFRMVTLTNSAGEAGKASLIQAGLYGFFEHTFSVDNVAQFKPAREVYAHVARMLNARPSDLRLIAAHAWDTLGALSAGYSAALVARPGNAPLAVGAQPDIVEPDLLKTATRIIEIDR
ncbi:MAG TPA: HAD-IA family hydrolase [Bryobacteraceae bacterium]